MTFFVLATGQSSVWLTVDQRLSSLNGPKRTDDGVKLLSFDGLDGAGLMGYAGLGKTARGMQPSEWMAGMLRGHKMTVQSAVNLVARGVSEQVGRHLPPNSMHSIGIAAIVDGLPELHAVSLVDGNTIAPRLHVKLSLIHI